MTAVKELMVGTFQQYVRLVCITTCGNIFRYWYLYNATKRWLGGKRVYLCTLNSNQLDLFASKLTIIIMLRHSPPQL